LFAAVAQAAGTLETPMLDPWVPPALREAHGQSPRKARPRAQVIASSAPRSTPPALRGTLTRDGRAAALGFIANHFESIDARCRPVGFDDCSFLLPPKGAATR
jgi:hypothetical protein